MFDKIIELFQSGGQVMPFLVIGCFVMWYGLVYRLLHLKRGSFLDANLLLNREVENKTSFLHFVNKLKKSFKKKNPEQEAEIILHEAHEEFGRLDQLVTTIVMVAPLLGLLGTVGGMIETFDSLGDSALFSSTGGIAGGIGQALITTQMGLAVAIPGLIMGRMLKRQQSRLMVDLEQLVELGGQNEK